MIGQERTVLPLLAEREFGLTAFTAGAHVHRRVRRREGGHQLLRRHPVGPLRPQTGPGRRLAVRPAGAAAADLGAVVGLGDRRQRPARRQPGPHLVHDRDHEDRPRRAGTARVRDGLQRGRRLRRGRHHRAGHRLHRRERRAATRALLPRPRLRRARARPVGRCSSARPRATPTTKPPRTSPATTATARGSAPARCSASPASGRRRCRRAARPGWSTTSTTASPGACSRSSSPTPG